jgi:phosphatidylglycerol:prolipoprotein diacylglycerol transferase
LVALIYFPLVLRNRKYFVKDESNPNNFIARQVSMWIYVDSVLPTIFIGQILGRFGNYFNHEIYGAATTNEGMINFLKTFFPWMYINSQWHLPVFFFEQIGNIVGLFLIYFCCELITNKKIRKCGSIGIMYFIWYGLLRLWMTYLRKDGGGSGGEDVNFITTILWIVFGFLLLLLNTFVFYKYTRNKRIIWFFFYSLKTLFSNQTKAMKQQRTSYAKANFLKKSEQMFWYNNY